MGEMSIADVAAMGNSGCNGSSWVWIVVLLFLFFGFNGGGMNGNAATKADLDNGFNFAALERQNNEIIANSTAVGSNVINAVKDGNFNTLGELRDIQSAVGLGFSEQQKCCCDLNRSIDAVNYNLSTRADANTQKILDAISTNRMADMQNQINQLQLQSALCGVVRYPNATTYNAGSSCFCNNGCNC